MIHFYIVARTILNSKGCIYMNKTFRRKVNILFAILLQICGSKLISSEYNQLIIILGRIL